MKYSINIGRTMIFVGEEYEFILNNGLGNVSMIVNKVSEYGIYGHTIEYMDDDEIYFLTNKAFIDIDDVFNVRLLSTVHYCFMLKNGSIFIDEYVPVEATILAEHCHESRLEESLGKIGYVSQESCSDPWTIDGFAKCSNDEEKHDLIDKLSQDIDEMIQDIVSKENE